MNKKVVLKNLSKREREQFIEAMLDCEPKKRNFQEIIASWEATAEINSNLKLKNRLLEKNRKFEKMFIK